METQEMLFSLWRGRQGGGGGHDFSCKFRYSLYTSLEDRGLIKEATIIGAVWNGFRDLFAAPLETSSSSYFHGSVNSEGAATWPVLPGAGKIPATETPQAWEGSTLSDGLLHVECAFTSWCKSHVPKNSGFFTTPYHHHASNGFFQNVKLATRDCWWLQECWMFVKCDHLSVTSEG